MAELYIDGVPHEYRDGEANLLATCLSLGFDLPYFCWHPALHSVGACRQCAVKLYRDENDAAGRLVMSCMTAVRPGMRVSIEDPGAVEFRAGIVEWLMVNHPHDCPICDEGGECHLQDMTVMTGHTQRRYRHPKRTHRNQYLGPFLNHEMNRCIECYRCVRFYRDYAGGDDLNVFGWHDHVYFGRVDEGVLESEFSGNLVEICPTGVFTDKTLKRHYTRKWDLETAPSICTHCSLGCNTIPGERDGTIRRISSRYSSEVNGYFLCDRGRFGYEYANSSERVRRPRLHGEAATPSDSDGDGAARAASGGGPLEERALSRAEELLSGKSVIGIGSPRASLESNFALRNLVGADRFYHGVGASELELLREVRRLLENLPGASVQEAARCDGAVVIGEDLHNTAPILALALRSAAAVGPREEARASVTGGIPQWDEAAIRERVQARSGPLFVATPAPTKLDAVAERTIRRRPAELAAVVAGAAHEVDRKAPAPRGLDEAARADAGAIAGALVACTRPLVVCGTSCLSLELLAAAGSLTAALIAAGLDARISLVVAEANSLAAALLEGGSLDEALEAVERGGVDTVVVVENDLSRRMSGEAFERLGGATRLLVIDHIESPTTRAADLLLPAANAFEGDGTYVNNEGRAQRAVQVAFPAGEVREAWRWLGLLEARSGRSRTNPWRIIDNLHAAMAESEPLLRPVRELLPPLDDGRERVRIPRMSHRASGRTAIYAGRTVHEPPPPADGDSPMSFSMEGYRGLPPAALIGRYWSPGWNSVQAINKFQIEVAGLLKNGRTGRLLLGHRSPQNPGYAHPEALRAEARAGGQLLLLPAAHLHGSEELSVRSPGVRELTPEPYIGLGEGEAADLADGETATLAVGGRTLELPVRRLRGLAPGVALYPLGLPGAPYLELPQHCTISVPVAGKRSER